jgi:hypothetical protein
MPLGENGTAKHAEYAQSSVMPWKFRTIPKAKPARNEARLYGICPYYRIPVYVSV